MPEGPAADPLWKERAADATAAPLNVQAGTSVVGWGGCAAAVWQAMGVLTAFLSGRQEYIQQDHLTLEPGALLCIVPPELK